MKKYFLILAAAVVMVLLPSAAYAEGGQGAEYSKTETIYVDEEIIIEERLTGYDDGSSVSRATQTKSASKDFLIKNSDGNVVATYTLNGTFSYNGSSATCTKASYSTSVSNIFWSFSSASATKSGSSAKGAFTAKCVFPSKTISKNVTLTCSKNGTIS